MNSVSATHPLDLSQGVQLVIGASGGVGLALVEHQLQHSSELEMIAAARRATSSNELADLKQRYPDRLSVVDVDITEEDSVESLSEFVGDKRLRLLINASGLLHDKSHSIWPEKRLEDITRYGFDSVMSVNAWGNALLLSMMTEKMDKTVPAIWAALSARVGSITDNRVGGWYSYRASKAALNQILKTASIECRRRYPHLIIAALHPGTTDSALSKPFQANVPTGKLFTPSFVAAQLMNVLSGLGPEQSGGFFAWDGQAIEY